MNSSNNRNANESYQDRYVEHRPIDNVPGVPAGLNPSGRFSIVKNVL